MAMSDEHYSQRLQHFTGNGDFSNKWKILEWDDKPQTNTNKQTKKYWNLIEQNIKIW